MNASQDAGLNSDCRTIAEKCSDTVALASFSDGIEDDGYHESSGSANWFVDYDGLSPYMGGGPCPPNGMRLFWKE